MEVFARRVARFLALPPPPRHAAPPLRALGLDIEREALPAGLYAVWSLDSGRYRVRVSPFLSPPRADFALWHEWFEIMASRPCFPRAPGCAPSGRDLERMADRFAARLMMPADAVARAARTVPAVAEKAGVLAGRFGVSASAMRRRLREMGLHGAASRS